MMSSRNVEIYLLLPYLSSFSIDILVSMSLLQTVSWVFSETFPYRLLESSSIFNKFQAIFTKEKRRSHFNLFSVKYCPYLISTFTAKWLRSTFTESLSLTSSICLCIPPQIYFLIFNNLNIAKLHRYFSGSSLQISPKLFFFLLKFLGFCEISLHSFFFYISDYYFVSFDNSFFLSFFKSAFRNLL